MSLMKDIKNLPDGINATVYRSWHYKMKTESPEEYGDLVEVVEDWLGNGVVRQKFLSKSKLYTYLAGKDSERILDPPALDPSVSLSSFKRFIDTIKKQSEEANG